MQERGTSCLSTEEIGFSPLVMLSPRALISRSWENPEDEPGAYTTCSLLTWEGEDGQNRPLITFQVLLNSEVLQMQGKSRVVS